MTSLASCLSVSVLETESDGHQELRPSGPEVEDSDLGVRNRRRHFVHQPPIGASRRWAVVSIKITRSVFFLFANISLKRNSKGILFVAIFHILPEKEKTRCSTRR
jgi:hypothetical protein